MLKINPEIRQRFAWEVAGRQNSITEVVANFNSPCSFAGRDEIRMKIQQFNCIGGRQ
ncbi:MAG: hypothetical protein HC786_00010 [Richelia sp. CSU_2_1]|nr:hypothetical protein [Microcoleus sp. SM1_3_4]NJR20679.1 hypothetical protein [Richelia sp. CSU_2_1]